MKTTETAVQAILISLPKEGDKLTFRIAEDNDSDQEVCRDEASTGEIHKKLCVKISKPLGQTACHLEGLIEPGGQEFTADLTYNEETTLADGRIIIYD